MTYNWHLRSYTQPCAIVDTTLYCSCSPLIFQTWVWREFYTFYIYFVYSDLWHTAACRPRAPPPIAQPPSLASAYIASSSCRPHLLYYTYCSFLHLLAATLYRPMHLTFLHLFWYTRCYPIAPYSARITLYHSALAYTDSLLVSTFHYFRVLFVIDFCDRFVSYFSTLGLWCSILVFLASRYRAIIRFWVVFFIPSGLRSFFYYNLGFSLNFLSSTILGFSIFDSSSTPHRVGLLALSFLVSIVFACLFLSRCLNILRCSSNSPHPRPVLVLSIQVRTLRYICLLAYQFPVSYVLRFRFSCVSYIVT